MCVFMYVCMYVYINIYMCVCMCMFGGTLLDWQVTCRTPFGVVLVIQFPNPKAVAAEAEAARERRKRSFGSRKRHQEDEVVGGDEECEAQHFMDFLLEHIMQVDMMMGKMVASCLRQLHVQGARNVVTAIRQGMECWSFNMFSVSMSQFCLQQSPSLHRSASEFMNSIVYFSRAQRLRVSPPNPFSRCSLPCC